MSEQPSGAVPRYAFERAMDIINGLMDGYKDAITHLAEAKPAYADELATHLAEVVDSVHAALGEALTPPR